MFHAQGSIGRDPHGPGQVKRRYAVLGLGYEIDAEKPYLEREFGGGKYCLPDQGCLRMTTVALVDFAAMDCSIQCGHAPGTQSPVASAS